MSFIAFRLNYLTVRVVFDHSMQKERMLLCQVIVYIGLMSKAHYWLQSFACRM